MLCALCSKSYTPYIYTCTNMTANSTKTKDPWNYVKDGEYWYKEYEKDNIIPIPITTRQEKKTSSDTKLGNGSRCGREDPELTVQLAELQNYETARLLRPCVGEREDCHCRIRSKYKISQIHKFNLCMQMYLAIDEEQFDRNKPVEKKLRYMQKSISTTLRENKVILVLMVDDQEYCLRTKKRSASTIVKDLSPSGHNKNQSFKYGENLWIPIPGHQVAWQFMIDPQLPFQQIDDKKWCIGFGHINVGYPNLEQYLILHADYLSLGRVQLLSALPETNMPRLQWRLKVMDKKNKITLDKIIYDTGDTKRIKKMNDNYDDLINRKLSAVGQIVSDPESLLTIGQVLDACQVWQNGVGISNNCNNTNQQPHSISNQTMYDYYGNNPQYGETTSINIASYNGYHRRNMSVIAPPQQIPPNSETFISGGYTPFHGNNIDITKIRSSPYPSHLPSIIMPPIAANPAPIECNHSCDVESICSYIPSSTSVITTPSIIQSIALSNLSTLQK